MAGVLDTFMEFHPIHGTNVQLDPTGTRATRVESFANGLCFSKNPLNPGEIFLVEIEDKELGWCGHLRIGLTAHDPRTLEKVPEYSLPDLTDLGSSWVFAITRNHNRVVEEQPPAAPAGDDLAGDNLAGGDLAGGDLAGGHRLGRGEPEQEEEPSRPKVFFTSPHLCIEKMYIPMDKLVGRSRPGRYSHILDDLYKLNALPPTARRSRIGVVYVPRPEPGFADMHIVINGEDMGASAKKIPTGLPLYAVVDVFAATKCVRIVQVEYGFASLQTLCRQAIQKNIVHRMALDWLELPEMLKNFCKYE
ncbi:neuralized-like protein 2 [Sardina pilchardus]|uniref:neuralized-like protein 2 n=1 Tax=Sardina pilchardus TaxID=27697 RepID=UPI002E11E3D4